MKAKRYEGFPEHYVGFKCPGCKNHHILPTAPNNEGKNWGFNGDFASPTLTPSILHREFGPGDTVVAVCHSFVRDGQIQFLSDCTHSMAGQTVPLEELKE